MPGVIQIWPGNTPPAGWLLCNGQAVSRTTYANLFSVLGTAYGQGNGSTTFNVPDLTGRVPVGSNSTYPLASKGGEAAHALTSAENGPHTHDRLLWVDGQPVTLTGSESGAYRVSFTYDKGGPNMVSTSESGQGQAHNNMQPYIAQHYIIKY